MRFGCVNRSRSSARHSLRYRVGISHQCARRVHAALCSFPYDKVLLHRESWLMTKQYLCRVIAAYLPTLHQQWTALPTLSDATTLRMLVSDNSLVAWYRIKDQCSVVSTLSALVLQREQKPAWYRKLVSIATQELMSELFVRA